MTKQKAPALHPQICTLVARLWPSSMLSSPRGEHMLYTMVWSMGEGSCLHLTPPLSEASSLPSPQMMTKGLGKIRR